jgi:CelD/BcsL family acetyltransferase involved in cellulose biosynthesis
MIDMDRITSGPEIECLMPEWQALWQRIPNATPFQSPEWLLAWWSCFGNAALSVLTARKGGQLIGLFPVYILGEPGCRKLLPFGISLSDYLDLLADPVHPGVADALLEGLIAVPGWDECYLPDLSPSSALLAAKCPSAIAEDRRVGQTCPVLRLPSAVEGLGAVVPRKTLRDLRQARRRAAVAGGATVTAAESTTLEAFMDEFFQLHQRRWHHAGGEGVCADPVVRRFHLMAAKWLLNSGILRLYLLQIQDSPMAVYYGFMANHTAYAYLTGFDPDYAELSPGTQIVGHAIEEAVREGAREFHFLRGGEAYKYGWGAVDRPNTARTLTRRRRC